jgi:hypothetical protein
MGQKKSQQRIVLGARETRHLIVNELLGNGQLGTVLADSSRVNSLVAVVMQYQRASDGAIASMHGISLENPLGSVLRGSYNTFLGQHSYVVLVNPTSIAQRAYAVVVRNSGEKILDGAFVNGALRVPARGVLVEDVTSLVGADDYGVVSILAEREKSLLAYVIRERNGEYVIPTPLR